FLERALHQRRRQGRPTDIPGADEENAFHGFMIHGASRPAARRNSAPVIAPSRTSRASGRVQSTIVDGGEFPSTPPSRTSSCPDATAAWKSRMIASAPGAGGAPGRFAEVEV